MKRKITPSCFLLPIAGLLCGAASGELLITQYYEGTSNNKFIELTNTGSTAVDLSTYSLTRWSNAISEDWKIEGSASAILQLSGSLAAGETYVIAHGSAAVPFSAAEADLISSSLISFNGDDSVVLYQGLDENLLPVISSANIVDAIALTDFGNEGANLSIVRKTLGIGYNTTVGSTYLDFPAVWEVVLLETVNSAVLGSDFFIGSSALGSNAPTVSFSSATAIIGEQTSEIELSVQFLNPGPGSVSVDVIFDAGASSASLADIGNYTTQTLTFPAGSANGDTQTVTITITNDSLAEPTEQAIFNLGNIQTTDGAVVGGNESLTLTIQDDDTVIPPLYISEIADPSDNFSARFVELHNPSDSPIDLDADNWNLVIYFNANTSGVEIPLSGVIPAGGIYLIARDLIVFEESYPGAPTPNVINSSINFNGNDNLELRFAGGVATGIVVDVYGVPGVDGVGTEYAYEDSQVVRNVQAPNSVFTVSEWVIVPASTIAMMTPGSLDGTPPSVSSGIQIKSFSINFAAGSGVINATGLGTKVWTVETSADLGQSAVWTPIQGGASEQDQPDGSVNFLFFFTPASPSNPAPTKFFYRLAEVAN